MAQNDGCGAEAGDAIAGSWSANSPASDPLADHLRKQVVDAVDMLVDDAPVTLESDDDHLVDLLVVEHDLPTSSCIARAHRTQPLLGATGKREIS